MDSLTNPRKLSLQDDCAPSVLVLGEVLRDVFDHSTALGGAPLNFAAHARRLGYSPLLISAVGADSLGHAARAEIAAFGLDTSQRGRARHCAQVHPPPIGYPGVLPGRTETIRMESGVRDFGCARVRHAVWR